MVTITFTNLFSSTRFAREGKACSATRADFIRTAKVGRGGDFYTRFTCLSEYARSQAR